MSCNSGLFIRDLGKKKWQKALEESQNSTYQNPNVDFHNQESTAETTSSPLGSEPSNLPPHGHQ